MFFETRESKTRSASVVDIILNLLRTFAFELLLVKFISQQLTNLADAYTRLCSYLFADWYIPAFQ